MSPRILAPLTPPLCGVETQALGFWDSKPREEMRWIYCPLPQPDRRAAVTTLCSVCLVAGFISLSWPEVLFTGVG